MRKTLHHVFLPVYCFLWATNQLISAQMCAVFEFPTITDLQVTWTENSVKNITFALRNLTCSTLSDVHIRVYKSTSPYCELWTKNGSCSSGNSLRCSCITPFGPFLFTKALDRTDSQVWIWYAYENILLVALERITFNITYSAQVTSLTLNGEENSLLIPTNQNVRISCFWENGYPPTSMALIDGNGNILLSNTTGGIFAYLLRDVQCHNTGVVHCMADGAKRNRSATLLVKCAPDFVNMSTDFKNVLSGENVHATHFIRSYTHSFNECSISGPEQAVTPFNMQNVTSTLITKHDCKLSQMFSERIHEKCLCVTTGHVPGFLLSVHSYDVRENDSGKWRIHLSNEAGTGSLDLVLNVTEGPPKIRNISKSFQNVTVSQSAEVCISFRTFSPKNLECQLTHYRDLAVFQSSNTTSSIDALYWCSVQILFDDVNPPAGQHKKVHAFSKCHCNINGTIPELSATIHIYDITVKDDGYWRFAIKSLKGTDYTVFSLRVMEVKVSEAQAVWITTLSVVGPSALLLASVAGVVVVITKSLRKRSWSNSETTNTRPTDREQIQCIPNMKQMLPSVESEPTFKAERLQSSFKSDHSLLEHSRTIAGTVCGVKEDCCMTDKEPIFNVYRHNGDMKFVFYVKGCSPSVEIPDSKTKDFSLRKNRTSPVSHPLAMVPPTVLERSKYNDIVAGSSPRDWDYLKPCLSLNTVRELHSMASNTTLHSYSDVEELSSFPPEYGSRPHIPGDSTEAFCIKDGTVLAAMCERESTQFETLPCISAISHEVNSQYETVD